MQSESGKEVGASPLNTCSSLLFRRLPKELKDRSGTVPGMLRVPKYRSTKPNIVLELLQEPLHYSLGILIVFRGTDPEKSLLPRTTFYEPFKWVLPNNLSLKQSIAFA